jgi:aconitase A
MEQHVVFFPIDEETLKYLRFSGRDEITVNIVEKYAKEQGLWANDQVEFTDTLSLDMSTVSNNFRTKETSRQSFINGCI